MNKGQQFWLELWREGRTGFHRLQVNADLISYWPLLQKAQPHSVLVPLCGKSLDMLWLVEQGMQLIGIELCEQAVIQFAEENNLTMQVESYGSSKKYWTESITIWVADIFTLPVSTIAPVDIIYDRAALIALPEKLRANYVQRCLQWLKPQGQLLLKTMSYPLAQMTGPPFSVSSEEVTTLYRDCSLIKLLSESQRPVLAADPLYARGLREAQDKVWLLQIK